MRKKSSKDELVKVDHQLKDFTALPVKDENLLEGKAVVKEKTADTSFIRRRYSFENRTGGGYQGL